MSTFQRIDREIIRKSAYLDLLIFIKLYRIDENNVKNQGELDELGQPKNNERKEV